MSIDFNLTTSASIVDFGAGSSALQNVAGGTAAVWIIPRTNASTQFLFNISTGTLANAGRLQSRQTAALRSTIGRRLDAESSRIASVAGSPVGTLEHRCAVINFAAGTLSIYINGVLAGTNTLLSSGNSSNTASLMISLAGLYDGFSASSMADGQIQDFRIFNRVLGDVEINNLVQARGRDSIVFGQTDRWKCNQLAPGTDAVEELVYDSAVDRRDGTIRGFGVSDVLYANWLVSSRRGRRAA